MPKPFLFIQFNKTAKLETCSQNWGLTCVEKSVVFQRLTRAVCDPNRLLRIALHGSGWLSSPAIGAFLPAYRHNPIRPSFYLNSGLFEIRLANQS